MVLSLVAEMVLTICLQTLVEGGMLLVLTLAKKVVELVVLIAKMEVLPAEMARHNIQRDRAHVRILLGSLLVSNAIARRTNSEGIVI